jgi:hypothetical protein
VIAGDLSPDEIARYLSPDEIARYLSPQPIAVLHHLIGRDFVMAEFGDPVEETTASIPTCRSQKALRTIAPSGAVKK